MQQEDAEAELPQRDGHPVHEKPEWPIRQQQRQDSEQASGDEVTGQLRNWAPKQTGEKNEKHAAANGELLARVICSEDQVCEYANGKYW